MSTQRRLRSRRMRGISLVELMIGITLGLLLLLGLSSLYLSNSLARAEFNKSAEQIENGRYALDVLARDLELAGFMGAHHLAKTRRRLPACRRSARAVSRISALRSRLP